MRTVCVCLSIYIYIYIYIYIRWLKVKTAWAREDILSPKAFIHIHTHSLSVIHTNIESIRDIPTRTLSWLGFELGTHSYACKSCITENLRTHTEGNQGDARHQNTRYIISPASLHNVAKLYMWKSARKTLTTEQHRWIVFCVSFCIQEGEISAFLQGSFAS